MPRVLKEYAVYQGDEFLMIGTANECAKEFGVKPGTVRYWVTEVHHKNAVAKKGIGSTWRIAIVVEVDDE